MNTIAGFAGALLTEQRRNRRWRVFFQCLLWLYLLIFLGAILWSFNSARTPVESGRHTALVRVEGLIAPGTDADADKVIKALRRAAESPDVAAILVQINSPGGTPVQAAQIYRAIQGIRRTQANIPVYAVIGDVGASGGYYVAAAAEKIFASPASVVGSIGVRAGAFDLTSLMERIGIKYRLLAAGDHKVFLDPFVEADSAAETHFEGVLGEIHQQFIAAVRAGRGDRLKVDGVAENPDVFTGLVWSGQQAVALGLVDELADARDVAERVIGAATLVDYTEKTGWFERAFGRVGSAVGAGFTDALVRLAAPAGGGFDGR